MLASLLDRSKIQTLNLVTCILPDGDANGLARIILVESGAIACPVDLLTRLINLLDLLALVSANLILRFREGCKKAVSDGTGLEKCRE